MCSSMSSVEDFTTLDKENVLVAILMELKQISMVDDYRAQFELYSAPLGDVSDEMLIRCFSEWDQRGDRG